MLPRDIIATTANVAIGELNLPPLADVDTI